MARSLSRRIASTALAAALLAAIAAPALAQPAASAPPPAATAEGHHSPRHHRGFSPEQHKERMAKHAEALKQKLHLTPAQEPAWNAFTTALQPQPGVRHARIDPKGAAQLTAPERIDRARALRAQRAAEADRRGEAVKTFYAALSPEQQKTFDAESFRKPPRMGGPRGEHGGKGPRGGEHVPTKL